MKVYNFVVENQAHEGVKRITQKVARDFEKVGGVLPAVTAEIADADCNIIVATLGKSELIRGVDTSQIEGKREVYFVKFVSENTLVICGSDKRGTIYGLFGLSEYIGVSPLHFWGDVEPVKREQLDILKDVETVSKEPSVKYRGFFINDEWPCFGHWTFGKFGGFTAEMYDHVFELLLRLKGNYLWPAMWTSSFPLDGPGELNEELADIYGVVMGASHHEPCLRASEEWDLVRGENTDYGNDWNYYINKNGLLKYWEDGLKRSGKYEKIITIGMRGERDSSMLGDNSTLKDNIDLLKDIIKNQRELIKKHVNQNLDEVPQLLALYKEVEEYFYGNEQAEGLKFWDELDNVICMLCEDNFGFMRTLPTAEVRSRKGGWGMYYHFDYHGGPVSYEWMPSTAFERTWEQMSMAHDYGIKDVWIVNVGDLKFNEISLAYFMELAYDFEKWGTNSPNKIDEYISLWTAKTFPSVELKTREKIADVLQSYIGMNALRRPEAQNAEIFHPCHYLEADRMLEIAGKIAELNDEIMRELPDENTKNAYYSLIWLPAAASANLMFMNLYAAKNRHYAEQGKKVANKFAEKVTLCIERDRELFDEFARFKNGKWKGMELEEHIGFTKWNDDGCRYPLRVLVEPFHKPRMLVSRKDNAVIYNKTYGPPMTVKVDDFLYAGNSEVAIEIANDGTGKLDFNIEFVRNYEWLEISSMGGSVEFQEEIFLRVIEEKLPREIQVARFLIKDKESAVAVEVRAKAADTAGLPPMTFVQNKGVIVINSNHYCAKKDVANAAFLELKNYGRTGTGMKVFPTVIDFDEDCKKPSLTYRFLLEESAKYTIEIWTTPTNSVQNKRPLRFVLSADGDVKNRQIITAVAEDFKAGSPADEKWCRGVLDNIRACQVELKLEKGVREITVEALEAGLILERILVYKSNQKPEKSYLGPRESWYKEL
ncbi:MAG: glycosyl hydrolase 115 family protein [Oscillospiraceae bacterium]|nr:glycosyl hydrolase 115 family protein [Oscillospiraceae bacterium]